MACLQALCGLRMLEAAALRLCDVDLEAGTISVTDTAEHAPKTRNSYRTVPVCAETLDALREAIRLQKVCPAMGELFTNSRGALWNRSGLGQRWRKALGRAALDLKAPRLADLPARKLRAAFATTASRLGAQDRLLKAYLGHAPGDMLGGHYRRIELAELRTVSDAMNGWREAQNESGAGNILATAERRAM